MQAQFEYKRVYSKPKYLCRWWLKIRQIDGTAGWPIHEIYCPLWAKPLDFIWKLIFGNPRLIQD